jgi:hypothetical protein
MLFCPHCCFKDKIDNARFATQEAAKQTTSSPPLLLQEGNADGSSSCLDHRRAGSAATMNGDVID